MISLKNFLFLATAALAAIAVASGEASPSSKLSLVNENEPETLDLKFRVRYPSDRQDELDDAEINDFDDDDDDDDFYDDEDEDEEDALTMDDDDEFPSNAEVEASFARRKLYNDKIVGSVNRYDGLRKNVFNTDENVVTTTGDNSVKDADNTPDEPEKPTKKQKRKNKRDIRKKRRQDRKARKGMKNKIYTEEVCKKLRKKFKRCKKKLKSKCKKPSKKKRKTMKKRCKNKKKKWKKCVQWLNDNAPTTSPDVMPSLAPGTTGAPTVSSKPSVSMAPSSNPTITAKPTLTTAPSDQPILPADPTNPPTLSEVEPNRNLVPTSEPTTLDDRYGIIDVDPSPTPNKSASLTTKAAIDQKTVPLIVEASYKVAILELLKGADIKEEDVILDIEAAEANCDEESSPKTCFIVDLTVTAAPGSGTDPDAIIEMIRKAIARGLFAKKIENASGLTGVIISPSAISTSTAAFDKNSSPTSEAVEAAYKEAINEVLNEGDIMAEAVLLSVTAVEEECESKYSATKKCFKVDSTTTVSPTSLINPKTATKKIEKSIALSEFEKKVDAASEMTGAKITIPLDSATSFTTTAIDENVTAGPSDIEAAYAVAIKDILEEADISADDYIADVKAEAVDCSADLSSKKCFDVQTTLTTFPSSDVDPDDAIRLIRKAIARGVLADNFEKSGLIDAIVTNSPYETSITHASVDLNTVAGVEATVDDIEGGYQEAIKSILKNADIGEDDVFVDLDVVEVDCSAKLSAKKCFNVETTITSSPTSGVEPAVVMDMIEKAISKGDFASTIETTGLTDVIISSAPSAISLTTASMDEGTSDGGLATASNLEAAYEAAIQSILEEVGMPVEDVLVEVSAAAVPCSSDTSGQVCFSVESEITGFPSAGVVPDAILQKVKKAIAEGVFADKIESVSALTSVVIESVPSSTSLTTASVDENTIAGVAATIDDIEAAYSGAIKDILKGSGISEDDALIEVDATETECDAKLSESKCFSVASTITFASTSGVDPEAITEKMKKAVTQGVFADNVETASGLTNVVISNSPSAVSLTSAKVDETTSTGSNASAEDIVAAYEKAIDSILEEAGVATNGILVEVEAVAFDCDASSKKCFSVESRIASSPYSIIDPADAIEKIKKSVTQGVFADKVEAQSGLTNVIIENAPSSTSVTDAMFDEKTVAGEAVTSADVDAAYEHVIGGILKKANIKPDDVLVEIEAVEADCIPASLPKKCFNVESVITSAPDSGVDADAIVKKMKMAVAQGDFAKQVEGNSGMTSAIISNAPFITSTSNVAVDPTTSTGEATTADDVEAAFEIAILDVLQQANVPTEDILVEVGAVEVDCVGAASTEKKCFKVDSVFTATPGFDIDMDSIVKAVEMAIAKGEFGDKVDLSSDLTGVIVTATDSVSSTSDVVLVDNVNANEESVETGYNNVIDEILKQMGIDSDDVFVEVEALETECEESSTTSKCFTVEITVTASPNSSVDPETVIQKIEEAIAEDTFDKELDSMLDTTGSIVSQPLVFATLLSSAAIDDYPSLGEDAVVGAYTAAINSILDEVNGYTGGVVFTVAPEVAECEAELTAKKCFDVLTTVIATPSSGVDPEDIVAKLALAIENGIFAERVNRSPDVTDSIISNAPWSVAMTSAEFDENTSTGLLATDADVESAYEEAIKGILNESNISPEDVLIEVDAIGEDCGAAESGKKCFTVESMVTASSSSGVVTDDIIKKIKAAVDQGDFAAKVEASSDLTSAVILNAPSMTSVTNASVAETTGTGVAATADDLESAYEGAIEEVLEEANIVTDDILFEIEAVEVDCGDLSSKKCFKVESVLTASPLVGVSLDEALKAIAEDVSSGDFEKKVESYSELTDVIISAGEAVTSVSNASVDDNTAASAENLESAYEQAIQSILKEANIAPEDVFVEVETMEVDCEPNSSTKKCFSVTSKITASPTSAHADPLSVIQDIEMAIARGDFADLIDSKSDLTGTSITVPLLTASAVSNAAIDEDSTATTADVEAAYQDAIRDILEQENIKPNQVLVEVEAVEQQCGSESAAKKCFSVKSIVTTTPSTGVDPEDVIQKMQTAIAEDVFEGKVDEAEGISGTVVTNAPSSTSSSIASVSEDSKTGTEVTAKDVEEAYKGAIESTLAKDSIDEDDVLVDINAVEVDCGTEESSKKCYAVETVITSTPSSTVDPGAAVERIQTSIADGDLASLIETASILEDVVLSNAPSSKSIAIASFDESTSASPNYVESVYEDAVKDILRESNMLTDGVNVEVEAVETDCAAELSGKKCFDVVTSITAPPSSGVDVDVAVGKVKSSIDQGDLASSIEATSNLTDAVITNAPSSTSVAIAAFDEDTIGSSVDAENAFEATINGILTENDIATDDILVEVEAVEVNCDEDLTDKKCFNVETTITASPSSGVDPDTAMQIIQQNIVDGGFAANIEETSDATGAIITLPLDSSSLTSIAEVDENTKSGTPSTDEDVEEAYKDVIQEILDENNMGANVTIEVDAVEGECEDGVSSNKKCFDVETTIETLPTSGVDINDATKLVSDAINSGIFDDKIDLESDLTSANITLPLDSSSSNSIGEVDENKATGGLVTEDDVEGAYSEVIQAILEENMIDPNDVTVEVDAIEGTCGEVVASHKKCFDIETTIKTEQDSDVEADDVIKKINKHIDSGTFDEKVGVASDLTGTKFWLPVTTQAPSSPPTAMPSASTLTNAAFNRRTAGEVVKAAYEVAIDEILNGAGISTDGLVVDVESVEGECRAELSTMKCYEVEITVRATPSSGTDPEDAIQAIEKAISNGDFAKLIEDSGVSGGIIGLGPLKGASASLTTIASTNDKTTTNADVAAAYDGAVQAILGEEKIDSNDVAVAIEAVDAVCAETTKDNCFRVDVTVTADNDSDVDPNVIIEKLRTAVANGIFDQMLETEGLAGITVTVPEPKSATLVTDASFVDPSTTEGNVEDGYMGVIEEIITEAKINADDVSVEVDAVEVTCEIQSTGSCFKVESTVTAKPGSGVDPEYIIEKLHAAVADGKFGDKLAEKPGLTGADVFLPSASLVMDASFGDEATTTTDVEAGYTTAIENVLDDAEISSDDVTFEVAAVEVECNVNSSAAKCFEVETTVTATPNSDVDPKDVIEKLRAVVIDGSFEDELEKTGLVDPEVSVPMDPTASPTLAPTISWAPTTFTPKCQVALRSDPNNLVDVLTAIEKEWIEATFNRRLENVRCVRCVEVEFTNCRDVECVEAESCLDTAFTSTLDIFDPTTLDQMNVLCIGDNSCKRSAFTGVDAITCRGEDSCARAQVKRSYELDCTTDKSCSGLEFA